MIAAEGILVYDRAYIRRTHFGRLCMLLSGMVSRRASAKNSILPLMQLGGEFHLIFTCIIRSRFVADRNFRFRADPLSVKVCRPCG